MPLLLPDRLTVCCLDFISFMQLLRSRRQQPHRDSGETRLRRLLLSSELQPHSCGAHPVGFAVFDNLCYKTPYRLCAQQTNRTAQKLNTNLQETLSSQLLLPRRLLPLASLLLNNNATSASAKKEACARNDDGATTCTCRCPCHRQDVFCRNSKRPRNAQLNKPLLRRHERQPGF